MAARLAKSKSGHDRGHYYVILKEEQEYVYLVDGVLKTVGKPKKKNVKHIQVIKNLPNTVAELLSDESSFRDLEIKRALKLYVKSISQQNVSDI
jgi:ribosomal protein L14E/L6E/L27E